MSGYDKIPFGTMSQPDMSGGGVERAGVAGVVRSLIVKENIPFGHKVALRRIAKDEPVIKYGEVIGKATADIGKGEWVHVHNLVSLRGR